LYKTHILTILTITIIANTLTRYAMAKLRMPKCREGVNTYQNSLNSL